MTELDTRTDLHLREDLMKLSVDSVGTEEPDHPRADSYFLLSSRTDYKGAYEPISSDDNEIRLLVLLNSVSTSDPIESYFLHIKIRKDTGSNDETYPGFDILSCGEGSSTQSRVINIDNKDFHVQENLFHALNQLRSEMPSSAEAMLVWTEAICVNQKDVGERNRHVSMMPSILKKAQKVILWLGEASEERGMAMALLNMTKDENSKKVASIVNLSGNESILTSQNIKWEAISKLVQGEDWSNLRVMQAVLLAKQTIIQCGEKRVEWDVLSRFLDIAQKWYEQGLYGGLTTFKVRQLLGNAGLLSDLKFARDSICEGRALRLLNALVLGRQRHTRVALDHVYGVLGLIDTGIYPIQVDYEKSTRLVFTEVATQLIQTDQNLDVLSACKRFIPENELYVRNKLDGLKVQRKEKGHDICGACSAELIEEWKDQSDRSGHFLQQFKGMTMMAQELQAHHAGDELTALNYQHNHMAVSGEELEKESLPADMTEHDHWPSWVPNWAAPVISENYLLSEVVNHEQRSTIYNASAEEKPSVQVLENWSIGVKGLQFSIIKHIKADDKWEDGNQAWSNHWSWYQSITDIDKPYGDDEATQKAFGELLFLGRAAFESENILEKPYRMAGLSLDGASKPSYEGLTPAEYLSRLHEYFGFKKGEYDKMLLRKQLHHYYQAWGEGMFLTENGYMGRARSSLHPNDLVCVLLGGKTPYILRERDDGAYTFVGECYVQGIMNGEALQHSQQIREFVLK